MKKPGTPRKTKGTRPKSAASGPAKGAGRGRTEAEPPPSAPKPELVIITGLSGSGKGPVLKCLEDLGYYAVDNLPLDLLSTFAELTKVAPNVTRAALVIDIRGGEALQQFPRLYRKLRRQIHSTLVFLEAEDATLVRRYSETRRPHPLGTGRSLARSVRAEREQLEPIRKLADHVINTSKFNVHDLRDRISDTFASEDKTARTMVYVSSFGFRHGVPTDADLVFDVRFLPNPNYIPEYRHLTGRNPRVARYIRNFPQTDEFLNRITDLLIYLLPHYVREGKSYLTIAFGCTGGHHRSVMMADEIRRRVEKAGYRAKVTHRALNKPV